MDQLVAKTIFFLKRVEYNMVDDDAYIHWISYFIVPFPFPMTVGLLIGFRTKLTLDESSPYFTRFLKTLF